MTRLGIGKRREGKGGRRLSGSVRSRRGTMRRMRRREERGAITAPVFCTGFNSEECSAGGRCVGLYRVLLTLENDQSGGDGMGGVGE